MTVSPSVPATVQMRRSRLLGLVAIVAVAAAAVTWGAFAATDGSSSARLVGKQATPSALVEQYGRGLSSSGSFFRIANPDLQLTPREKRYVDAVTSLSRVQQAAAYGGHGGIIDALGLNARDAAYVTAIVALTPAQIAAGFGTSR